MKKRILTLFMTALLVLTVVPAATASAANASDYPLYYSNFNTSGVSNDPDYYPDFTVDGSNLLVQAVTTYHWNYGTGSQPGTISIYDWDDNLIGTWQATGRSGSGANNVFWDVFPNVVLKADQRYYIVDSDTDTWSYNSGSDDAGFVEVRGTASTGSSTGGVTTKTAILNYRSIRLDIDGTRILPVDVNGNEVEPFIIDGTTYLPLRAVAGALGCSVGWDDATSTITLNSGARRTIVTGTATIRYGQELATLTYRGIKLIIDGSPVIPRDVNGNVVDPFIIDGTTYMPVRALAETLGCSVGWDDATSTVIIHSSGEG